MKPKFIAPLLSSLVVTLATFSPQAHAVDIVWGTNLGAGPWVWNTGSNWTGGTAPVISADRGDLRKDWTAAATINFNAPTTTNGVLFDDTGASGDVGVTLANNGTAANTLTLAGTTPELNVTGSLTVSTVLAGTVGFNKTGTGTLNLSNIANTYTGSVSVGAGTLQLGNLAATSTYAFTGNSLSLGTGTTFAMPTASGGTITCTYNFANLTAPISVTASTLSFVQTNNTTHSFNGALAFSGSNIVTMAANAFGGHTVNLTRAITGSGTLTFNTTGNATARNFTVSGTGNNYTGTVVLNTAAALSTFNLNASLGAAAYEVRNSWTMVNNASGALNSATGVSIFNTGTLNLANPWNNAAATLAVGGGTVTLASTSSTIGALTISASATLTGTTGNLAPSSITVTGGTLSGTGTLAPRPSATIANTGATTGPAILTPVNLDASGITINLIDSNASGSDLFFNGSVTSSAGFTKTGVGALAFGGPTTISGPVVHNQGLFQLNGADAKSFSGGLSGSGSINLGGTGLTTFSGPSGTFTGSITVPANANIAGEAITGANLTFNGGGNLWPDFSTPGSFTANNITLNGVNTIRFTTSPAAGTYSLLKYNGVLSGTGTFSANFRGASINPAGGVGGNEIVLTIGTPVGLIWNNAASTSIWNAGAAANWLNDAANDFFFDADTVAFNDTPGANQAIVVSGVVSPGSITFTSSNDTVNYSFTGALPGDGISGLTSLVKNGDAAVTLGMANTYSGGTTLNEGLLRAANNSALSTGTVTINGGALATDGTLATTLGNPILLTGNPTLGNTGDTGVLTLAGAVTLSGADRTITTASDATISGVIGGATFGLTKSGSGTLTLTNTNTYSSTTVNGGVLQVGSGGTVGAIPTIATVTSPGTLRYFRSENGVTLANTFSGDGTLAFRGTGTINQSSYSLTGTNTGLTGTLQIESGAKVLVTTAAQLGSAANVNIASGGQLYLNGGTYANTFNIAGNGWNETAGQLGAIRVNGTITGPVALTGPARLSPFSTTGTISGTLTGTDALEINSTAASFTGTLTYSGNGSAFSGPTTVSQGTLNLTGSLGGSLSISSTAFAAGLSGEGSIVGALTLGAVGRGANLSIDPNTAGAFGTAAAFTPAESGTVVTVNFSPVPSAAGTYTVLNYASTTAVPANFALAPGYRPVVFDTTSSSTATTVTTTAEALTWKGTTAVWDVNSTANWKSATVDPEKFYNIDSVLFDDTATNFAPTLAVTASPSSVTFNNSTNDYTVTGAGGIGGSGTLTKSGTGTVTLSTTNTYTGAVTINSGILKAGAASALGSSAGGTTINATGTLDLNAQNLGSEAITLAGGKIISSSATAQIQALTTLNVTANSAIGGTGRWDVRGATGITTVNSGVTLTKEDANLLYIGVLTGSQVINNGSIQVNAGTLGIWQSTISGSGSFSVNSGATLAIETSADNPQAVSLAGGTLGNLSGSAASTQSGAVTLTANSSIASSAQAFNLTGGVSESGGSYGVTIPNGTVNFNSTASFTGGLSVGPTSATASTVGLASLTTAAGKEIRIGNTIASGLASQTLNVSGTVANSGTLHVGRFGLLNINTGAAWTQGGGMTLAGQGGYTATLTLQSGATLESTGTGLISINGSAGNSGLALLNLGGTMTVSSGFTQTTVPTSGYGRITFTGGTLKLGATVSALTNQVQTVLGAGGGTIDTNGFNTALSGTVTVGATTAGISGTGSLTKIGAGTLTLTGTNGYSGATLLNVGTLAGNGAASSALTAAANTTVAPGVNIGTYRAAGATLAATSTLAIQIDSTTDTSDKLVSTAAVDITGANVAFTEIGSGTITAGTKLVVLDYTGTTLTGTFSGLAEGAPVSVGGNTFTLSYTDSSRVTLTSTTVAPFASWATTNITNINPSAPAGFDDDADGDGFDNGLEWILGGNPLAQDASTLITSTGTASGGLTLDFQRADESIGFATLFVEYDADLAGTWTSLNVANTPPFANGVTVNITPGSPEDAISVNIPASPNAPDGKLFGRVRATQP